MIVPAGALVGANDEIVGGGRNVNPASESCPVVVRTRTKPRTARSNGCFNSCRRNIGDELALTFPNATVKGVLKLAPSIVTVPLCLLALV